MCGGSKPKTPKITQAPIPMAPPIVAPIEADRETKRAGDEERRRRVAATGRSDTILTGGLGDKSYGSQSNRKKLLGQ